MKAIPVLKCRDMTESLRFYTQVLDFVQKDSWSSPGHEHHWSCITHDDTEIHLSSFPGDGVFGVVVYLRVERIDALFLKYQARGLDTSSRKESPVHQRPVNQTWGMREFYVDDPSGNVLRFGELIRKTLS
jgi:catechol 2,3-dioxygenase-like lactoylglutathione lyase family enzyme